MDKIFPDGYRVTDEYVFFWGSFLSNFQKTKFKWGLDGEEHEFFCTEQAFMWVKAKFFGDKEVAEKILGEKENPMVCKKLGRSVSDYDDEKWSKVRYGFMVLVNREKYSQDKEMRDLLLDPLFDGKTFVEASPFDGVWGIKMGMVSEGVTDPKNWKGENLLGKALTEVRNSLLK